MSKSKYMLCVDTIGCKYLNEGEVYLCKETPSPTPDEYFKVWRQDNTYLGCYLRKRFAAPNTPSTIDRLKEKVKEYNDLKEELRKAKAEINSIYSKIGEQLELEL